MKQLILFLFLFLFQFSLTNYSQISGIFSDDIDNLCKIEINFFYKNEYNIKLIKFVDDLPGEPDDYYISKGYYLLIGHKIIFYDSNNFVLLKAYLNNRNIQFYNGYKLLMNLTFKPENATFVANSEIKVDFLIDLFFDNKTKFNIKQYDKAQNDLFKIGLYYNGAFKLLFKNNYTFMFYFDTHLIFDGYWSVVGNRIILQESNTQGLFNFQVDKNNSFFIYSNNFPGKIIHSISKNYFLLVDW